MKVSVIQDRLATLPEVDPQLAPLMEGVSLKPAAILLPLSYHDDRWHITFTRRSYKVSSHKGEISFPGGRVDQEDPSTEAAALRETREELGIPEPQIQVLGTLPDSFSIAGYHMAAFVGQIPHATSFDYSEDEIDEVFTVPMAELITPDVLQVRNRVNTNGHHYPVYMFEWRENYVIWGATARLLKVFLEAIHGPLQPGNDPKDAPLIELPHPFGS